MKKLFFLLCITAAVLIAGHAHAAIVKVTSHRDNAAVSGCPFSVGAILDTSTFAACVKGKKIVTDFTRITAARAVFSGSSMIAYTSSNSGLILFSATTSTCSSPNVINAETGVCEPPPPTRCEILRDRGEVVELNWAQSVYGSSFTGGYYCTAYGCVSQVTKSIGCNDGRCFGDATLTGVECDGSGNSAACTDSTCSSKLEGKETDPNEPTPEPDNDNPYHEPDDPTSSVDAGGNVSNPDITPSTPEEVDPVPEVTTPESGEATDAIVNLNKNVNKALNDLNIDINKANSKIENELKLLNSSNEGIKSQLSQLEETNIKIADNNKALLTNLNRDITTSVNINTSAVNKLGGKVDGLADKVGDLNESVDGMASDVGEIKDSVAGLGESLDGLAEDVSGIGDAIDGLANIDGEGLRQGTCFSNPDYSSCKGWYEPNFPEGFKGVFDDQFGQLTDAVTASVNNIFGGLDLSNSAAPSFCLTLWMFGTSCFTDYLDLSWVFGFIRFAFMFTTVWLCRKLVFGG